MRISFNEADEVDDSAILSNHLPPACTPPSSHLPTPPSNLKRDNKMTF